MLRLSLLVLFAGMVSAGKYDQSVSSVRGLDFPPAGCSPTAKDILGPYYKPNTPFQPTGPNIPQICLNGPANDRLFLNGTVRLSPGGQDCGKGVKALLDIWHANADGVYSNTSPTSKDFSCRTKVYTNPDGSYQLSTIFPGRYGDGGLRPAHVHFKITPVDANNQPIGKTLTAQLYFYEDYYLAPRDSCTVCASGQPSLISHVQHISDIKTQMGTWDVLLSV